MVYIVGAGCGAKDLITVRGMRILERAQVLVYAGSLINPEILEYVPKSCIMYDSAKMTLEEITKALLRGDKEAKVTVRLHSGEPSLYGAIRQEIDELSKLGIGFECVPGVSACFGAAASLGIEYTLPGVSQSLIITRMAGKTPVPEGESIESLAAHRASMAIYLSSGMMEDLSRALMAGGYDGDTPAAIVYKATWDEEKKIMCTVSSFPAEGKKAGIDSTAVILVGDAVGQCGYDRAYLYSGEYVKDPSAKPQDDRGNNDKREGRVLY
ncbi:MAG: precorrin-4 C(11)-methyltransferase [Lachnospiraceae bacterium]|nr:precorrin-4 C(11)-methyltransferase [Lachnospiraceae bacterium]